MTPGDDTDAVRVSIENDQAPSVAVVEAVAALTNTELSACPPLHHSVNPDSIDVLFTDRDDGTVTFEYHNCRVTVRGDSTVTAHPT